MYKIMNNDDKDHYNDFTNYYIYKNISHYPLANYFIIFLFIIFYLYTLYNDKLLKLLLYIIP